MNEYLWQYEHIKQFIIEINSHLVLPLVKSGDCTAEKCPKMKATDMWLYLCACHKPPQDCSAVDYMIHALDNASSTLMDKKNFPDTNKIDASSVKYIQAIVRRLYRLFSHTYFHHEQVFRENEDKFFLCTRFSLFARNFKFMSNDLFIIPDEALKK